jgi:hypothetical protein
MNIRIRWPAQDKLAGRVASHVVIAGRASTQTRVDPATQAAPGAYGGARVNPDMTRWKNLLILTPKGRGLAKIDTMRLTVIEPFQGRARSAF